MRATEYKLILLTLMTLLLALPVLAEGEEEQNDLVVKAVFYTPTISHDPFELPDFSKGPELKKASKLSMRECRLVGVLMSAEGWVALIEDLSGESYTLKKGDKILGGKVSRIDDSTIEAWVREDGLRQRIRLSLVEEGE